jgi:hypothetical protein
MSMEDILKVLVNSRQQGSQSQAGDPMADLIGNLLGGGQPQMPQTQRQQPSGGLGDMMGLLEMFMGGNQSGGTNQMSMNNPIMLLLQPFVEKLAKKMNIPPQIAMVVVSFVAYKLLSHHPTSGRDSNSFDLDDMLKQMSSGKIDPNILQNSGMVNELSRSTGLDQATAAKSLEAAFGMFGKQVQGGMKPSTSNVKSASTASKAGGGRVSSMKSKGGKVTNRKKG